MEKYARIIVDIPAAEVDRIFDYKIPDSLKDSLQIGHAVRIPFGNREVTGFVVGFAAETVISNIKIKSLKPLKKKSRQIFKLFRRYRFIMT
mgnify:CR=1 FL=1